MKKSLVLILALGMVLLISPVLQGSSLDIETRLTQLEKRIEVLEEVVAELGLLLLPPTELPKTENATALEPGWSQVISWKGGGAKTTELFRVEKPWRIKWKNLGVILSIWVDNLKGDIPFIPVSASEKGEDVSYVYKTGEFYLTINASGKWEIQIEEKISK